MPQSDRNAAAARERAEALRPVLAELAGLSDRAVGAELNRRKIATPAGGQWHAQTVARVKARLGPDTAALHWRGDHGSFRADTPRGYYSVDVGSSGYGGNGLRFQPRPGPRGGRRDFVALGNYQTVAEAQVTAVRHYRSGGDLNKLPRCAATFRENPLRERRNF